MNSDRDLEKLEQLVFRYLYGDLTEQEKQRFETDLANNPRLQSLLAEEQAFDAMLPRGVSAVIDSERLHGNRSAVLQRLQNRGDPGFQFSNVGSLLRHPAWLTAQTAALGLAFALGLMLDGPGTAAPMTAAQLSPLDLVGEDDYEIYRMQVNAFDAQSGMIDLSFALASETRFIGNVTDAGIRTLVDAALRSDLEDADRLDAVEVLRYASQQPGGENAIPEGLIYALNSDRNPGVRYTAATSLAAYTGNEEARDALLQALTEDINPGVRLVAFDALAQNPDPNTLAVFRQRMETDGNAYIRDQSRNIIDQFESGGLPSVRF